MFSYGQNGVRLKIFVRETNSDSDEKSLYKNRSYISVPPLTGDQAKEFYEDVIRQLPSSSSSSLFNHEKKPHPQYKLKSMSQKFYKNSDLLQMAQNNNVKGLEDFFGSQCDYDVNVVDEFGWTPLMCASCSGAEEAVEILLRNGADVHKCDSSGSTAVRLARQKGNRKVVEMLQSWDDGDCNGGDGKEEAPTADGRDDVPFVCETCKEAFTSRKKHESSTLHLFNCKIKTCTFYGIPESNRGFQLLLREGWNKESGLGKDGKGRKFPVKAVMKTDRRGIGAQLQSDKNERDGHHTVKFESKRSRLYRRWKDKDFEKKFRSEFS